MIASSSAKDAPMPVAACRRNGIIYALQWLERHPRWKLSGWRCAPPEA